MKHSVPDDEYTDDYEEYSEDYVYVEDDGDYAQPRTSGAVVFLGAAAAVCLVIFLLILAASFLLPSLKEARQDQEDPDAFLHGIRLEEESQLKENPIVAEEETEATQETTIPPEANPFDQYDFQYNKQNYLYCLKQESYVGVDVSAFQHDIDWNQVKASGVDFAMLRLGYRGWGAKGTLVEDEYIQQNLAGTAAAGIPIGAYFFSQATTLDEVHEEIEFMLEILGDYQLDYPIVLDWEVANPTEGRVRNVTRRELTDMLRYFCDEMSARGFDPMVYFNWTQASRMIYLSELEDYPFWLALYQDRMTFPFRVEMWQYTSEGKVPGIEGDVDINVYIPDLRKQ
ncbi:MAG: glycoside hydrolase family 25 protein [Candidatus Faecousia sp.]|nr:glycoside hydrolase family 25 protein [Candidatus Faecousia sp.]